MSGTAVVGGNVVALVSAVVLEGQESGWMLWLQQEGGGSHPPHGGLIVIGAEVYWPQWRVALRNLRVTQR